MDSLRRAADQRRAVLLMGPTGAGKSALAVQIAARFPIEIISVDSAQVYRTMDVGTAKPDAATQARVRHHLLDIRDPSETYSAGEFVLDAVEAMREVWSRGCVPLLVGGTMLYFHALSEGIADLPERDLGVRAAIDAEAVSLGWPALHRQLADVDPLAASRIHANDPQRIQRALEVYRLTGQRITVLQQQRLSAFTDVNVLEFAIAPLQRSDLHTRIETRFMAMLEAGLLPEVQHLYQRSDLSAEHPSMRAVGYRQLWQHLAGKMSLNEATEQVVLATRQLAKRQMTWLRRRTAARWLDSMHRDAAGLLVETLAKSGVPQFAGV